MVTIYGTHCPPTLCCPWGHEHTPSAQIDPPEQTLSQVPVYSQRGSQFSPGST